MGLLYHGLEENATQRADCHDKARKDRSINNVLFSHGVFLFSLDYIIISVE